MMDRGDLTKEQGGFPRTTTWTLVSGDTSSSPVATSSDIRSVATGGSDVAVAVTHASSDTCGLPERDVTTEAEHALVDAIRDAFDAEELPPGGQP